MSKKAKNKFLSTPSARRATVIRRKRSKTGEFLSTPSARRATRHLSYDLSGDVLFLSTPSARRATVAVHRYDDLMQISIHALREEGDLFQRLVSGVSGKFLSTPSARRATQGFWRHIQPAGFLSTPSARRATLLPSTPPPAWTYFYPRPPRGGRRSSLSTRPPLTYFYPRPPRGGRQRFPARRAVYFVFLSTPSARRATRCAFP